MQALIVELEGNAPSFGQPVTICHTLTRHFVSPVSFITANRRFEVTVAFIHTKFCQSATLIRTKFCQFDTLIRTSFRERYPRFSGIAYQNCKDLTHNPNCLSPVRHFWGNLCETFELLHSSHAPCSDLPERPCRMVIRHLDHS